jgi:predicted ATP-dependent serine protease
MTTAQDSKPSADPLLKLGVYNIAQLKSFNAKAAKQQYLVDGFIGQQSLTLAVGDSNLGKSPFLYQMAVCVASGVPFLGMPVKQGPVLYMDAENSTLQVENLVTTLSDYLKLPEVPPDLYLFNKNNCPDGITLEAVVTATKPVMVVLDPIYAWFPEIEERPKAVTEGYGELRGLMKIHGCSVIGVHHTTKEQENPSAPRREPLDAQTDVHKWFNRARGTGALINGCDNRIGFDVPSIPGDCKLVGRRLCARTWHTPAVAFDP